MLDRKTESAESRIEHYLSDHNSPLGAERKYYDSEFLTDMQDLFSGRRAGHAFHHVMSGKAYDLWEQFTRAANSAYYPFKDEASLIQSNPDWFRMTAGLDFGEGSIVVELGTGSEYSAQEKTLPLLEAVNASVYVGVDKSLPSALSVTEKVRLERPQTAAFIRLTDFNKNDLHVEWHELENPIISDWRDNNVVSLTNRLPKEEPRRRIFLQLGSTLGNIEGYIDAEPPMEKVVSNLRNYRANMHPGDILYLGLDQNQDRNSLDQCYGSPLIAQFSMAMLQEMKKNLPVSRDFDPDNFEYFSMWNKKNGLYFHGFNTVKANSFKLGDEKIVSPLNSKVSYVNAWKLKQYSLEQAFRASDLRIIDALRGPEGRIHIHALEAV